MNRVLLCTVAQLGLALGGWWFPGSFSITLWAAEEDETPSPAQLAAAKSEACANKCLECAEHCDALAQKGKAAHKKTAAFCHDCAAICTANAEILKREGPLALLISETCVEACRQCDEVCEPHASHDTVMKACAEMCKECEAACRVYRGTKKITDESPLEKELEKK